MGKLQEPHQTSQRWQRFSTVVERSNVETSSLRSAATAMRLPSSSAAFSFRILSCTVFFLLFFIGKYQADSFQFSSASSKKSTYCDAKKSSSVHTRKSSLVMEQDTVISQEEEQPSSNQNNNNRKIKLQKFPKQQQWKHPVDGRKNKSWEEKYKKLKEFKAKYGHVDVPQQSTKLFQKENIDKELAIFCRNVRSQYKLLQNPKTKSLSFLTQDRIDKLEAIGFQWNSHDATWDGRYQELVNFYNQHGHSNVPTKFEHNPELSKWVSYQRLRYKGIAGKPLSNRQFDLLIKIDFRWTPKDEVWWNNYKQLKAFKETHGHFRVAEPKLKQWKYNLRRLCREYVVAVSISEKGGGGGGGSSADNNNVHVSGLNQERIQALIDIQFCWLPHSNSVDGGESKTTTTTPPTTVQPPENIFEGYQ